MSPTVGEIASKAGVSKSTVSLVLNNRPHVSEEMRKRVFSALEELKKNNSAHLTTPREKSLRILLLHPLRMGSVQVFRELLQGIQSGIESIGGQLTLALHHPPFYPEHTTSILLHDPSFRPDGVLLMGAMRNDPILNEIQKDNIPCVLIAREIPPKGFSTVGMDNFQSAKEAVEYLIHIGHRNIAFVGGDEEFEYTRHRKAGYIAAMRSAGLRWKGLIFMGPGDRAAWDFLRSHQPVTAVFFVNDEHAALGVKTLQGQGIRIPDDLSIIGFDDTADTSSFDPPLSSIWVPRFEIGELAAKTLSEQIARPSIQSVRILLKTQLRLRETSVQPPHN